MSNGEEEGKGNDATKGAFELLRESGLNFKGNVEGRDLFMSPIDVIAVDGFTGNLVLKGCEATAKALFKWLKQELKMTPFRAMGAVMAKGAFKDYLSEEQLRDVRRGAYCSESTASWSLRTVPARRSR